VGAWLKVSERICVDRGIGKCKLPMSLRAVFDPEPDLHVPRRYFWNCNSAYLADGDGTGCGYFKWAEFTEDGEPIWGDLKNGS
jgi:hypothetical protein